MKIIVGLGCEFVYENIVSYIDYDIFKLFQQINREWYELLDSVFFREEDIKRRTVFKTYFDRTINRYHRNSLMTRLTYNIDTIVKLSTNDCYYRDYGPTLTYKNGVLCERRLYLKDKEYGIRTGYHSSSSVRYTCPAVNGVLEGLYSEYNPDGSLLAKYSYEKGIKHGPYTIYQNGSIRETGMFVRDIGLCTLYATKGRVLETRNYKKDDTYTYIKHSDDGSIVEKGICKNGFINEYERYDINCKKVVIYHGTKRDSNVTNLTYDSDGLLTSRNVYNNYKLIQHESYDRKGNIVEFYHYEQYSDSTYIKYDIHNNLIEEGIYNKGKFHPLKDKDLTLDDLKRMCKKRGISTNCDKVKSRKAILDFNHR